MAKTFKPSARFFLSIRTEPGVGSRGLVEAGCRRQTAEGSKQKADGRGQEADGRRQEAEGSRPKAVGRS